MSKQASSVLVIGEGPAARAAVGANVGGGMYPQGSAQDEVNMPEHVAWLLTQSHAHVLMSKQASPVLKMGDPAVGAIVGVLGTGDGMGIGIHGVGEGVGEGHAGEGDGFGTHGDGYGTGTGHGEGEGCGIHGDGNGTGTGEGEGDGKGDSPLHRMLWLSLSISASQTKVPLPCSEYMQPAPQSSVTCPVLSGKPSALHVAPLPHFQGCPSSLIAEVIALPDEVTEDAIASRAIASSAML